MLQTSRHICICYGCSTNNTNGRIQVRVSDQLFKYNSYLSKMSISFFVCEFIIYNLWRLWKPCSLNDALTRWIKIKLKIKDKQYTCSVDVDIMIPACLWSKNIWLKIIMKERKKSYFPYICYWLYFSKKIRFYFLFTSTITSTTSTKDCILNYWTLHKQCNEKNSNLQILNIFGQI